MIILIGGESCTGKTVLAQRLLERYHIPYMSADHVKMGLVRGWTGCPFTPCDPDERIIKYLWPVLEGIVRTNVENRQHLILEGCYLPPARAVALEREYPDAVIAVYLGFTREYVYRAYETGILRHRNDVEWRGYDEERTAEEIARAHEAMRKRCAACGARYVPIDGAYEEGIGRAIALLDAFAEKNFVHWGEKNGKKA